MRKRIIINTANLRKGGALKVALSFVQEATKQTAFDFCIILGRASQTILSPKDFESFSHLSFRVTDIHPSDSMLAVFYFRKALSQIEKAFQPDAVMTVFGPCYWTPKACHIMGFGNGYLLYEDSYFFKIWKGWHHWKYKIKKAYHRYLLRREADFYWTETEETRQRLATFIHKPLSCMVVTDNNCSNLFRENDYRQFPNLKKKQGIRIFYPCDYYLHKGFEHIPKVLEGLEKQGIAVELLVTIDSKEYDRLFSGYKNVINLGSVEPKYFPDLYRQSDIVFMPSLLEIFSAVYPEAMYMQKPIVTTDLPFARNICQEAALYFEPENVQEAVARIREIILEPELAASLIGKGSQRVKDFDLPEKRFSKILSRVLAK